MKYSTVKKEILSIVLCISKFQNDLINKTFVLRVDCKSAKEILEKDVKNIVSKQIFARWQSILSCFDFKIEFIKGININYSKTYRYKHRSLIIINMTCHNIVFDVAIFSMNNNIY